MDSKTIDAIKGVIKAGYKAEVANLKREIERLRLENKNTTTNSLLPCLFE